MQEATQLPVVDLDTEKGRAALSSLRYHVMHSEYVSSDLLAAQYALKQMKDAAPEGRPHSVFVVYDEWTATLVWGEDD